MFKRVERRQKRKAKEEELGIDEEMKEAMGLGAQDTDSSESDSNSDDSDSGSEASGDGTNSKFLSKPVKGGLKRKRDEESDAEDHGLEADEGIEVDDEEAEEAEEGEEAESDEEDEEEDQPSMTVSEALQNPLHLVSLDPEIRTCVVCPGKLLKNTKMVEVHMTSNVCHPFSYCTYACSLLRVRYQSVNSYCPFAYVGTFTALQET